MTSRELERYNQLERFLNMAGKSGYVDVKPVLAEMAKLLNLNGVILKTRTS